MPRLAPSGLLLPRILGALLLRRRTFEEVAADSAAGIQSGIVVVVGGVLEAAVSAAAHEDPAIDSTAVMYGVLAALIGWMVWSTILFLVGVRVFGHHGEFPSILRAVAFTHAPVLVYGLAAIPRLQILWGALWLVTLGWFVAALAVAARGVLGVSRRRAVEITAVALFGHEVLHQGLRFFGLIG